MVWFRKKRPTRDTSVPVTVLIALGDGIAPRQLLVTRRGEELIPEPLNHLDWRHLAATDLSDRLLATARPIIEATLGSDGYALLTLA